MITRHIPLRRTSIKKHAPRRPKVDMLALKRSVVLRDKACLAAVLGFGHVCQGEDGRAHKPNDIDLLSLEHVKTELRMGLRAPDDRRHTVAVCYGINLLPPSKEMRSAFREYLARVEAVPQ